MASPSTSDETLLDRDFHDRLAGKTSFLKSLAVDIESEAKDHHRLLDGVGDDMTGAGSLLGNTLNRVKLMANSGRNHRQFMCYVSVAVVGFLFFFYIAIGKLFSSTSSTASSGAL